MPVEQIKPVPLSPSERLLREVLAMSQRDDDSAISDVIVIWRDADGRLCVRSTDDLE